MNVVVYGASGRTGSRIVTELLSRGHQVKAISRAEDDLSDPNKTAAIVSSADVVVSAYAPPLDDTDQLVGVTQRQIEALAKAGGPRLIVVGGAGSLEVAPGVTLLKSGYLPDAYKAIALSHEKALELLKASSINWTYLSPAGFFEPGERTGKFRLAKDELLTNDKGESRISMEDYAIALVDEIEHPKHERQRFAVAY